MMNGKTLKMKLMSVVMIAAMVFAALGVMNMTSSNVYAAENEITVYVTVSNAGELATDAEGNAVANLPVTVAADETGLATIDAALSAFHDVYYPEGYTTMETAYGLSVSKLWGVENGGSYLFAINGIGCSSGVGYDYIGNGDKLTAVVMHDLTYWSDLIATFDKTEATANVGEEIELALTYDAVTYDENWNAAHVATPVVGASVYAVGAEDTVLATTDTMGKAFVTFDEAGTYVVTASGVVPMQVQDWSQGGAFVDADAPISAPACVVTVTEPESSVEPESPVEPEPPVEPEVPESTPVDGTEESTPADGTPVVPEAPDDENLNVEAEDDMDKDADAEGPADEPNEDVMEEVTVNVDEDADEGINEDVAEDITEDPAETEKAPATGDAAQTAVYLMVLIAAACTAVAAAKKQK